MALTDLLLKPFGYTRAVKPADVVEKSHSTDREGIAQNPLASVYLAMNNQYGLRKPSKITFQTLRRMAAANWVDRTCIFTLRDEITGIPWDIVPNNPKEKYDTKFQQYIKNLLLRPNRNNENWRTLIDKIVEDILVVDAGCIEKVRNKHGIITELWHLDGATIKPCYDEHGVIGDPAYQQFLPGQKENKPMAEWRNEDVVYIMWNPQGTVDSFGFGLSPVEAGLAVGTAFLYAEAYNLGFFKTNTIPPMLINMGKDASPGEVERFRSFMASEMAGNDGFHQPIIGSFNEGFSVENLLPNPKDMAWQEYTEWQMRWKVALYRMSPQDIGFTLDQYKTEGVVQEQLSQNKAINSLKNVIKQYIDAEIINDVNFTRFSYNLQFQWIDSDIVDPLDQAAVDKIYLSTGKTSINELRVRDGQDPIVGGQKPFVILGQQLITLDPTEIISSTEQTSQPVGKSLDEVEKALGAGETKYAYQSTQLDLPVALAKRITRLGNSIPDADINAIKGGRETDIHVTALYGLATSTTADQIRVFAKQQAPIEITLGKVSKFTSPDGDVLKIDVQSTGLHRLYESMKAMLAAPGSSFPVYQPHITIAYVKSGCCENLVGNTEFEGAKAVIDTLTFSDVEGNKVLLPLGEVNQLQKAFNPEEGAIIPLSTSQSAICWMDDRGVTQPLFVTDESKRFGFQIKSSFLDDRKGQEPPEAEVARILRAMKVNTPEVQIMTYEQVLQLLPEFLYPQFTAWLALKPPFDSQEWRRRWGDTRKSNYYIVTGFISGMDLGNSELQRQIITSPESYINAIQDFAKIWVAERLFYLGDRKPGHYIITQQGNGFGVDYQFYKDKKSYEDRKHHLPQMIALLNSKLYDTFAVYVQQAAIQLGTNDVLDVVKAFRRHLPRDWERMNGYADIEKRLAKVAQKAIYQWYKKAVHTPSRATTLEMRKAKEFDPTQDYLTNGNSVYQNGVKFPMSVLPKSKQPTMENEFNASFYKEAFTYGADQAKIIIDPSIREAMQIEGEFQPNDPRIAAMKLSTPDMMANVFNQRADQTADVVGKNMGEALDDAIVRGLDQGKGYAQIADDIRAVFGVDENDPELPGWRAERIARTEAQWAISEGMREQYLDAGINKVNVSPAMTACDVCEEVARGNPYNTTDAQGIIPVHPNCRCVLVGNYDQFF